MMEFQKLNLLNFFCVFSIDSKVSLEKNIPPGTMIAEKSFMKKGRKLDGVSGISRQNIVLSNRACKRVKFSGWWW